MCDKGRLRSKGLALRHQSKGTGQGFVHGPGPESPSAFLQAWYERMTTAASLVYSRTCTFPSPHPSPPWPAPHAKHHPVQRHPGDGPSQPPATPHTPTATRVHRRPSTHHLLFAGCPVSPPQERNQPDTPHYTPEATAAAPLPFPARP